MHDIFEKQVKLVRAGEHLKRGRIDGARRPARQLVARQLPMKLPFAHRLRVDESKIATGRLRRLRVDAIVAATAMVAGASLVTGNKSEFLPFVEHGLKL